MLAEDWKIKESREHCMSKKRIAVTYHCDEFFRMRLHSVAMDLGMSNASLSKYAVAKFIQEYEGYNVHEVLNNAK